MRHVLDRAARSAGRGTVVPLLLMGAVLLLGGRPSYGQAAHMDSTLTSTHTFQVLQLSTDVVPLGNGLYRWSFTLTNPLGNRARGRFFTAAPNCDLSQISNIQSPPGWVAQVYRNKSEAPDAPKINWFIPPGQPGPFSPFSPWLNPVPGQNVKVFSFDLPFGANNQSGHVGALDTYGFSGATLGCQIGNLSITGACPPMDRPTVFEVSFNVQFQNRGDVTITITRGGSSLSQTLSGITTGSYSVDFNLGAMPSTDEIVQINGTGTENGVSFTASATARITAPIVIVPGIQPTDPADSDLGGGSPQGLVSFLSGGFPSSAFVCPPLIKVAMFCPPNDPLEGAVDMLAMTIEEAVSQSGGQKVHLIGHGGGAILARAYLKLRDQNATNVRSLTLVSPPNKGMLRAILSPNRDAFTRYWPAYPFWGFMPNMGLFMTPQNLVLTQQLGFLAPPVPTAVIYGTGVDTPAIAYGSATNPYRVDNASGDGTVTEMSATALLGASYVPIPGLQFVGGLNNPAVEQAVLQFILAH
jgi:pimeloyl-ACP methyl ester carboxylesterase